MEHGSSVARTVVDSTITSDGLEYFCVLGPALHRDGLHTSSRVVRRLRLTLTAEAPVDSVVTEHLQELVKLSAMCCKTGNNGSVARSTPWPTPCDQKCDAERKYAYRQSQGCTHARLQTRGRTAEKWPYRATANGILRTSLRQGIGGRTGKFH
jgi:hypothetical protein